MTNARGLSVIVLICMILSTMTICSAENTSGCDGAIKTARSEIWRSINSGGCGSATAAIMVDGAIVYAEGFGMADREKAIPVDTETIFNMGSISKVYDAAAIMLLVDDGKISLDKPVTEYLPEFRMADKRYRDITVRMTLNHTSGLPGTEGANTFAFAYNDNAMKETLETLAHSHLKHDPGKLYAYCNDGFSLAEMIVERVSGMKFRDFLQQRVFQPLDLKNTGVSVGELKGRKRAAYYEPKTGKKEPFEAISILGAGGLSCTAVDLCRFLDTFSANNRLFSKTSLEEIKKPQPSSFHGRLRAPDMALGLGWDMTELPRYKTAGLQVLGKSGGTGNYSSMCYTVPDKRISVAVIGSGPHSGAMEIALKILDAVLVDRGLIKKETKPLSIPVKPEKIPHELASYAGYYADGNHYCRMAFDMEKNTVTLFTAEGGAEKPGMSLVYNGRYFYDAGGNRHYFMSVNGNDYYVGCSDNFRNDMISMQKVKPFVKPGTLKMNLDGRKWVRRNASPLEGTGGRDTYFVRSSLIRELPGYVEFGGLKKIESPDFAGMPFDAIRDQTELRLIDRAGETWAQLSDIIYSPAESVKALKAGENSVKIGKDGYDEWLKTESDMIVSVKIPGNGRVVVISPEAEVKYDSAVDTGEVYAPKGSYIETAGSPDDIITVTGKPVSR